VAVVARTALAETVVAVVVCGHKGWRPYYIIVTNDGLFVPLHFRSL